MYYTLLRLYTEDRLTEKGLTNAISKGWISAEQKVEIINSKATS